MTHTGRTPHYGGILFALSFLTLLLEVVQMRLFAYSLQFFMVHIAVGVSMLGWGVGASILSSVYRPGGDARRKWLVWSLAGFATTIVVTHVLFARCSHRLPLDLRNVLNPIAGFAMMSLPYVFAGSAIGVLLTVPEGSIARLYMLNLTGSALGCVLIFQLLPWAGAPRLIGGIAACALALIPALSLSVRHRWLCLTAVLPTAGALLFWSQALFPFRPDATDQYQMISREIGRTIPQAEERREFQRWDPAGVAEVYGWFLSDRPVVQARVPEPVETRLYVQDGGAGSLLYNFGPHLEKCEKFFDHTIYGVPYFISRPRTALIIGLGGSVDVQAALHFGVEHITGVDINRAAISLVQHDFASFLGNPYGRPGVSVLHNDGRTVAKRSAGQFDLIHMTGADTKAIWVSAATILNTNFLYTREAFNEYWRALRPGDSFLSITRFSIDLFRLAATAWETLAELGVEDPGRHILITFQGMWGNLLVKKTPFTTQELSDFRAAVERHNAHPENWADITWLEFLRVSNDLSFNLDRPMEIAWAPDQSSPPAFEDYERMFAAYRDGHERDFFDLTYATLRLDHRPVRDDRPFFFFRGRVGDILGGGNFLLNIYLTFLGLIAALTIVGVFAPVWIRRRFPPGSAAPRPPAPPARRSTLFHLLPGALYFLSLGIGFMLIEIGLMQQSVIFLGNQARSVSVVLFGLLVFSGLGSLASGRFPLYRLPRVVQAAVVILLVWLLILETFVLPYALNWFIGWPAWLRASIVLAMLGPLGFAMGIPFPSGLRMVDSSARYFVPWGLGLNAFASVIGSVGFIVLALLAGFRATVALGGMFYLICLLTAAWMAESGRFTSPAGDSMPTD